METTKFKIVPNYDKGISPEHDIINKVTGEIIHTKMLYETEAIVLRDSVLSSLGSKSNYISREVIIQ